MCVFKQLAPLLEVPEEDLLEVAQECWNTRYGPAREPTLHGVQNEAYELQRNGYACPLT